MLPRVLFRLWRHRKIRDAMLPRLLHRLEPHLRRVDFRPLPPVVLMSIVAAIPGLIGLMMVAASIALELAAEDRGSVLGISTSDLPSLRFAASVMVLPMILTIALMVRPRLRERRLLALIEDQT